MKPFMIIVGLVVLFISGQAGYPEVQYEYTTESSCVASGEDFNYEPRLPYRFYDWSVYGKAEAVRGN